MKFLDVCGPPGSGKSTICDPIYSPHAIEYEGVSTFDAHWHPFLDVVNKLLHAVKDHQHPITGRKTIDDVWRMVWRSLRKIAVVESLIEIEGDVYVQTALAQRGLGFGWRLHDLGKVELIADFFRTMPVSLGVVLADAPDEVIIARNRERLNHQETAHENRDFMVPRMRPAIEIMKEVFSERGINFCSIDTTQPVEDSQRSVGDCIAEFSGDKKTVRPRGQIQSVSLSSL